jgi:hypothetical protein
MRRRKRARAITVREHADVVTPRGVNAIEKLTESTGSSRKAGYHDVPAVSRSGGSAGCHIHDAYFVLKERHHA